MRLSQEEKVEIAKMKPDDLLKIDDETRGSYQFEIEKPSSKEYRISKLAIMCLDVKYFFTADEVIAYIEKN